MALKCGPVLPAEIMDVVIDQLSYDLEMLGVCGVVCSEWLIRSRYHIFHTVHLWPKRARRFFELADAQECTFTKYVNCIEVDDGRATKCARHGHHNDVLFHEIVSFASFSRFSHIEALRIRNVDWTLLPPSTQDSLRSHLAKLTQLKSLDFEDVMFHDFREIARITSLFPSLRYLVTNVQFSKYTEHAIASATSLTLPSNLETLEIGTDDAIPVLLSTGLKELRLCRLVLDGIKFWHLRFIGSALRDLGGDLAQLDLIHQTKLQSLHISGIKLFDRPASCSLEFGVPPLISKLPPTTTFKKLTIHLIPESDSALQLFDWSALRQSVAIHPRCTLYIDVAVPPVSIKGAKEVREYVHRELISLWKDERLYVQTHNIAKSC
ncbi:hypothetical protein D9756_003533 [Leucocoprinus leucothites]|uniref:Uncharacterized protein n=1 Tax=Leucocoprinus leucothites TaxID=201217 RepID=A0A8H5G644_9AGAR|nr:hypothetical protein D9756_003533 [Leucoagaricus leucothites]